MRYLLIVLIVFALASCKKDNESSGPSYPKTYVYDHATTDYRVWANKAELIPVPFAPEHFGFEPADTTGSFIMLNNHQMTDNTHSDTSSYIMAGDTLKVYFDFIGAYVPFALSQGNNLIFLSGQKAAISNSSSMNTSSIIHFTLEDALEDLGYSDISEMQPGDTVAICNRKIYYTLQL